MWDCLCLGSPKQRLSEFYEPQGCEEDRGKGQEQKSIKYQVRVGKVPSSGFHPAVMMNSQQRLLKKASGCSCSVTKSCPTLYDPINCSTLGSPVLHYLLELLKFMCTESVMSSTFSSLLLLLSIFPSIRAFPGIET